MSAIVDIDKIALSDTAIDFSLIQWYNYCRPPRIQVGFPWKEVVLVRKAQGLYIISVASQILDMHPQTLRKYERAGFIEPPRMGTLRLYSEDDIARLRLIKYLVEELGLNLSGVELALSVAAHLLELRAKMTSADSTADARKDMLDGIDAVLLELGLEISKEEQVAEAAPPAGARELGRRGTVR